MRKFKLIVFLVLLSPKISAVDFGDGSDGVCNLNTAINTDTKNIYNCSSVIISTISVSGSKKLIIKSLGSVTISGVISLDGGDGANGANSATSLAGASGPGGFSGGAGTLASGDSGTSGGNSGEGIGGTGATYFAIGDSGGGGGGGARFGTAILPTAGEDGTDDLGGSVAGGSAGSNSYAPESSFESELIGGAGGGAGGSGVVDASSNIHSGGAGGGGAGVIRISTREDLTIEAAGGISANGGDGGDGSGNVSGGGGAGSGGAIFLEAEGDIRINGTVSALGGTGGDGTFASDNNGGNGGSGRIRYDDFDGVVTGTGSTSPSAVVNTIEVTIDAPLMNYDSSISCGAIGLNESEKAKISLLFLLTCALIGNIISKRSQNIRNL